MDRCAECGRERDELDWGEKEDGVVGYCDECVEYHKTFQTKIFQIKWIVKPRFAEDYLRDQHAAKGMGRE